MDYIQEIIKRYFNHKYPQNMELKIQQWLCNDEKVDLKSEALFYLWNKLDVKSYNYNTKKTWIKIANQLHFKKAPESKNRYLRWCLVASILIGVFIVSTCLWKKEVSNQSLQIATANGEYKTIILPDGSTICLNPCSQISYNKKFDSAVRRVSLQGEAYFNVKHIYEKPFIVKSKNLIVKVLGTKFNIKNYQEDTQASAYLERGSIQVSTQQASQVFILKQGEKIIYDKESKQMELLSKQNKEQVDLSFYKTSLYDIMNTLKRQFNIQIVLKGNTSEKYTIEFSPKASINDILDALCTLDENLSWEKYNQSFIIHIKQTHNEN